MGSYLRAQRLAAEGHLVVVDRHWLSEHAYGTVYRGGSAYPVAGRCFDRLWLRSAALYVLCVPGDPIKQEQDHHARDLSKKGNTYSRDRQRSVKKVIQYYRSLVGLAPQRREDDYLAQWSSNFNRRRDVVHYDRDRWPVDELSRFTNTLLLRLQHFRHCQHWLGLNLMTPNYAGHRAFAHWLMLGEDGSPRVKRHDINFPFVDRCSHLSSATWVNRALHQLRVPETKLLWCNARGPELAMIAGHHTLRCLPVIALGRVAGKEARRLGWQDVREVPHPQWMRRFHHGEDYSEILKGALR
jgi:hypothetical protein